MTNHAYEAHGNSLNIQFVSHASTMKNMSNQSAKRNVRLAVILAVVIVAIIAGGLGYQMLSNQSSQSNTMMTSETSMMGSSTQQAQVSLLGAGATFPAPLIQTWTVQYNKIYPAVTINYNPIGSGGGIQQITAKTVDFGASDAPLNDKQMANASGLVLFPETLGGVAITYNLYTLGISNATRPPDPISARPFICDRSKDTILHVSAFAQSTSDELVRLVG